MSRGRDEDERHRIAKQVADLKSRATPDAIRRMQGLLEAELARRGNKQVAASVKSSVPGKPGAALAAARRLNASATPPVEVPAGADEPPPGGGARAVLAHWMKLKNDGS